MIWHIEDRRTVLNELNVNETVGLTKEQVQEKEKVYGKNICEDINKLPYLKSFLNHLKNPFIIAIILLSLISLGINLYNIYQGNLEGVNWIEPIAVICILIVCILIETTKECISTQSINKINKKSLPKVAVKRDNQNQFIASSELVPGDIIYLKVGDLVPADIRLLNSSQIKVIESVLTGDKTPKFKDSNAKVDLIAPVTERSNMLYSGSIITSGKAVGVVVDTGLQTEVGKQSTVHGTNENNTVKVQNTITALIKKLTLYFICASALLFVIGKIARIPWIKMFLSSTAVAYATIPFGMLTICTIIFSIGIHRMAKKNAYIRHISSVEKLSNTSVICIDKTGTLTEQKMSLERCFVDGQMFYLDDLPNRSITSLIQMCSLCTDAEYEIDTSGSVVESGDPTEIAVLEYAYSHKMDKKRLMEEYPRIGKIPFDSTRKCMSSIHIMNNKKIAIVKGAPDAILSKCANVNKEQVIQMNNLMAKDALRVIAVAYKFIDSDSPHLQASDFEYNLTFAGLLGMIDPPKKEAIYAIEQCKSSGIQVIMMTGDHPVTATAIGKKIGIITEDAETITGDELNRMSDEQLNTCIHRYHVYARVNAAHKQRIISAWQRKGKIVTASGHTIADGQSLKIADVGCAMGSEISDVAKNAADCVLYDNSILSIVNTIKRSRGIYSNLRKAMQYILSCSIAQIFLFLFTVLIWGHKAADTALLPSQLLWINMIIMLLPSIAICFESPDYDILKKKQRNKYESIFANGFATTTIWQGIVIGILAVIGYAIGEQTGAFIVLGLASILHILNTRSEHSLFRIHLHTNVFVLISIVLSICLIGIALFIPFMSNVLTLHINNITSKQWIVFAILSIAPIVIVEIYKFVVSLTNFITNRFGS